MDLITTSVSEPFCTFSHQKTLFFTSFCTAHFDIQEITLTFTFQMEVQAYNGAKNH